MSRLGTFLFAVVLLDTVTTLVQTRRSNKNSGGVPIVGEDPNQRRKGKKTTDCHFGRLTYEIEDIWHPDLGPPFGVMYCIECECNPVQKKRRIVGRVRCRNIKNECPEPACDDPVLLTGKCCKTCQQDFDKEMQHEGELGRKYDSDDGERGGHEYAALLTSDPTVPVTHVPTLGSGRFALHRRNLHYSVQYAGPESPSMIAFTDEKGHIIEEHEARLMNQYNSTYKICGVWPKVPKVYRKLLKQEGVYVRITSESFPDGVVGGRVTQCFAVKTETFSTLLTPSGSDTVGMSKQGGGMAIISTASANSASHFLVVFHNLLADKDGKDTMVNVRIESIQRDDADGNVIEETLVMAKNMRDNMAAEFKMDFDPRVFRQMARGKLLLSVAPKHSPDARLSGIISPKVSCSVFHAVLSAVDSTDGNLNSPVAGAGQALFHLTEDGSVMFKIQVDSVSAPVTYVGLEAQSKKRWRTVHDLTSSFRDGWANGTLSRLSARDIELLMGEELFLTLGTERNPSFLRGQVKQRFYGEAHTGNFPLLLRTLSLSEPMAVGQAWLAVDSSCRVHYEVVVGGLGTKRSGGNRKEIVDDVGSVELLDANSVDGASTTGFSPLREFRLRRDFVGLENEDVVEDVDKRTLSRLDSGNMVLQVSINSTLIGSSNTSRFELRARVRNLHVPSSCLPSNDQNEVASSHSGDILMDEECNQLDGTESYKCIYEGRLIEEGTQWSASHNACIMCNCQRGRVICDPTLCPSLQCADAKVLPGDCCPTCAPDVGNQEQLDNNQNRGCYFEGDKKFHVAGSTWHPYVPPFGFSRCAVCSCNVTTLKVTCPRTTCKPLTCPEKEAYREEPMACCKVCPNPKLKPPRNTDELQDEGVTKDPTELLAEGGCKFRGQIMTNGMEWHPRVQPFGEIRCIRCYCKDGKTKCKRHKCPALNCQNKVVIETECCPKCADGSVSSHLSGLSQSTYKHKGKQGA